MRRASQNRPVAGGKRLLRCARGGAGTRPERKLRALERLLASPCARPRVEGESGDPRKPRAAAPVRIEQLLPPQRHPTEDLRPRPTRGDATDLETRALRARRLAVRLLRLGIEPPDARPCRPTVARRHVGVGERCHLVRAVQPQQGRPTARGDEHAASYDSAPPDTGALHPPDDRADPRRLAYVPSRTSCVRGNDVSPYETPFLFVTHRSTALGLPGE